MRKRIGFKQVTVIVFMVLAGVNAAFALTATNIVAYPVPFNPNKIKFITIGEPGATAEFSLRVDINIYDINGDKVFSRTYSKLPVQWNGRNSSGSLVKPGMYIIKVKIEDENESGDYGDFRSKLIRILVNY
ncbi:MAG: T9SS type A sorting domain-containing protein [bacterium]|nr:T9SS type A sorting domain-containing protein [bacterium]